MAIEIGDVVPAREAVRLEVVGGGLFPVRRIYCVGKNYSDHVAEMGGDVAKDPPVFFTKPADAATHAREVPYPPGTGNLHFEGELVVALKSGGRNLAPGTALSAVFGYGAGCDLTRRDLQAAAKKAGAPWDAAKAFDASAPLGRLTPADGAAPKGRLRTIVNGATRQDAALPDMIWSVGAVIAALSGLFELAPGDLIFTGTPAGVGQLVKGDRVRIEIDALAPHEFAIV